MEGLTSGVATVSAGFGHTCALTTDGEVKCWGRNTYGELGNGTTIDSLTPVDVSGLAGSATAISAGEGHTCATTQAGGLKCWGFNQWGQLGLGVTGGPEDCSSYACSTTPADVTGVADTVVGVSAGYWHTCSILNDGDVQCWGRNLYGELGDGTTNDSSTPVDVIGLTSSVTAISAGGAHTCAVLASGSLQCWGQNFYGELGDGTTNDSAAPVDVMFLTAAQSVSIGDWHTCAVTASGGVKCWGWNYFGQIGNGETGDVAAVADVDLATDATLVTTGLHHTCAATTGGGVKCWGRGGIGQLGDGTGTNSSNPVDVDGLESDIDGDGCSNVAELNDTAGSQASGGLRNPKNPNDYFNPTQRRREPRR